MTAVPLPAGKLPADLLSAQLSGLTRAGDVRLGPAVGEDACALDVDGRLVVAATDPITLTSADVGRYAVIVNANDVAVAGARPRWFLATVLLPIGTTAEHVTEIFATMTAALDEIGAVLVGGHTEVTGAVNQPVVIGQMLGVADRAVIRTAGASPDDALVLIGTVPVEGASVLAAEAGERLHGVPADVHKRALHAVHEPGLSVVEAALTARDAGATAMHDLTEGGVAAGLHELATAAQVSLAVDIDRIPWFEPGVAVCRALGADPMATLASGALLATFAADDAEAAVQTLTAAGHRAALVGTVERGEGVRVRSGVGGGQNGEERPAVVPWPERDEVARVLT